MSRKMTQHRPSHAARTRSDDRKEAAMRVELQTDGGIAYFPGLSKPVVVNSDDLPKAQASQLRQLIDDAHFFELPTAPRARPKGAADMRSYTITVEDGKRRSTVRLA